MVEKLVGRLHAFRVLIAFATIYLVWGSTFLAIRVAIEHIPPLLMCAARLLIAGALMLAWARLNGAAWPRGREWGNAALVGIVLPAIGNASVTLGETHVPSGLVALLVASIPLWMALLSAFGRDRVRPGPQALLGLALGFGGIALLIGPGMLSARRAEFAPLWALIPVAGSLVWAWGSLWSRRATLPESPVMSTAVGLLAGGFALLAVSALAGEPSRLDLAQVGAKSVLSLLYLSVFGTVIAFSAYLYLLRVVPPAIVSTYAFVNPVVAMALGWAFAGESPSARTLVAAVVVIGAVALITTARSTAQASRGSRPTAASPPVTPAAVCREP